MSIRVNIQPEPHKKLIPDALYLITADSFTFTGYFCDPEDDWDGEYWKFIAKGGLGILEIEVFDVNAHIVAIRQLSKGGEA